MASAQIKWGRTIAVLAGVLVLSACGGGSSAESGSAPGDASGGGEDVTVAVQYGALFFPYHSALKGVVDNHAAELGGVTIIDGDSAQDTAKELSNVQNHLTRNPDCLLVIPVDFKSPAAAEAADAAGVPFVSFDQKAGGPIDAFVGYDQTQAGEVLGQFVVDQYKALGKPTIKLLYLRGIPGHPADTSRDAGLKKVLADNGLDETKVEIFEQATDFDRAKSESAATTLLTQNPDIDVMVGNNDDITLGAQAAADKLGIATGPAGTLHMVGVDGIPEMLSKIADGTIDATGFQNPIPEAKAALDACVAAARGEQVSDNVMKFTLLTQDKAAETLAEVGKVYQ